MVGSLGPLIVASLTSTNIVLSSTLSILPKSTSSSTAVVFFFSFLVNFSLVGKDDASPHFIPKIFNGPDSTLRRILNVRQISMV